MTEPEKNENSKPNQSTPKVIFDVLFMVGVVLLLIKIGVLLLNKIASMDISLLGGKFLWNFGPLVLMIIGGIGSNMLKDRSKQD